jgi:hypothetical protein
MQDKAVWTTTLDGRYEVQSSKMSGMQTLLAAYWLFKKKGSGASSPKPLISISSLVAGVGFEPTTFGL